MSAPLDLGDGARVFRGFIPEADQAELVRLSLALSEDHHWLAPITPGGQPFSVRQANFGALGWISDRKGYRYERRHPITGAPWPPIPELVLNVWRTLLPTAPLPECCLVNHYADEAKMGMHRDQDEDDQHTPILSISLGAPAQFRLGGPTRTGKTRRIALESGDVLIMGGASRHFYHGIDRLLPQDSLFANTLPVNGRLNLTLRRVTNAESCTH